MKITEQMIADLEPQDAADQNARGLRWEIAPGVELRITCYRTNREAWQNDRWYVVSVSREQVAGCRVRRESLERTTGHSPAALARRAREFLRRYAVGKASEL